MAGVVEMGGEEPVEGPVLRAEALVGRGWVFGAAMEAMLVWRFARLKPWPGVFSKIWDWVFLSLGALCWGLAGGSVEGFVRRVEALVGRGRTAGGLRLATGARVVRVVLVVEPCEAGTGRAGGVHARPRRSMAALDIFGVTIGSVTAAGIGRARNTYPLGSWVLIIPGDSVLDERAESETDWGREWSLEVRLLDIGDEPWDEEARVEDREE